MHGNPAELVKFFYYKTANFCSRDFSTCIGIGGSTLIYV